MSLEKRTAIIEFLRSRIKHRIACSEETLDNDAELTALGLKSLDVVLISGEIEDHLRIEVDPIMMFEHRTIHAVADHLVKVIETA